MAEQVNGEAEYCQSQINQVLSLAVTANELFVFAILDRSGEEKKV